MMVVFVAVLFGSYLFRSKLNPQPTSPPAAPAATPQTPPQPPAAAGSQPDSAAANAAAPVAPVVQASAESTTVVENELYRITFTNRGAQVTSWILKQFKDDQGRPLELVNGQAAKQFGYPLSLYSSDGSLAAKLNQASFIASVTGQVTAPATLTFKYSDGNVQATKIFTFDGSYVLHATAEVSRGGTTVPAFLSWPGGFGDQDEVPKGNAYFNAQFDSDRNGSDQHVAAKKVNQGETINGPFDWAGVSDAFFAAVFMPDSPAQANVVTFTHQIDVAKTIKRVGFGSSSPATGSLNVPVLGAALGDSSGSTQTRIFVGPKAINVLRAVHAAAPKVTLGPLLEFGFWGPIGKYLFLSLQFIHSHIVAGWSGGSWGWAIILLTVIINLLMLPFRVKTMQSALKMQRIQPQMDAIKERYKKYKVTDPKRNEMNAEIMQLQKDNGVNMFGGCIPTLITMPLLFAFYTMLPRVIELRQAHWFWLPDLQNPDPIHILPILMVVSQFLVQFYTPSPGVDPQQQRMMAFVMPVFSGYICWQYASGLALYWSVGNVIGIAQQAVMNRTSLGREMREIALKRARRKGGGGGPTIQARK